jgi:hypothetical protein
MSKNPIFILDACRLVLSTGKKCNKKEVMPFTTRGKIPCRAKTSLNGFLVNFYIYSQIGRSK